MKTRWIALGIFVVCAALTAVSYNYCDIPLAYYCKELNRSLLDVAEIVTIAGESKWYYILFIPAYLILRLFVKNKIWSQKVFFLFISISVSGLINTLIKWLAGRNRPINLFNNNQFGYDFFGTAYENTSFPSGHAVTAFTLAATFSILFPRWKIPAFTAAAFIGITRIMLTSHYLSDVLAGAALGILCTLAVKYMFDRYDFNSVKN